MSDPAVQRMTETQWTFELVGLVERDKRRYDDISSIMKTSRSSLIDILGLNLMPVEEDFVDEEGQVYKKLRKPSDDEVMPLSLMCGNETVLSEISKLHKELKSQEELDDKLKRGEAVQMTPEELDSFMDDGDIVFPDNPADLERHLKWNSEENKQILSGMVLPLEEKDRTLETPDVIEGQRKKSSRLIIK